MCRLETRLIYLERGYSKRKISDCSTEVLMNFKCVGRFEQLGGEGLAVATFENDWLFVSTSAGILKTYNVGIPEKPTIAETIALSRDIKPSDELTQTSSHVVATCLCVLPVVQSVAVLFAGLNDGRIAVFRFRQSKLEFVELWPETNKFFTVLDVDSHHSATHPVNCLVLSPNGLMLGMSRGDQIFIFNVDSEGIDSVMYSHTFLSEICDYDEDEESMASFGFPIYRREFRRPSNQQTTLPAIVKAIMFDDDAENIFCAFGAKTIAVFTKICRNTHHTWKMVRPLVIPFETVDVTVTALTMAAGNSLILAGGSNGKLYVFEKDTVLHYRRIGSPAGCYTFSHVLLGNFGSYFF